MGDSSVRDTGSVGHLRRRLILGAGGALFVVGAVVLGIGLASYFDDGESPAPGPQSVAGPLRSTDEAEIGLIKNLPVAIPYYNPQRPEPQPQVTAPLRLVIESIGVDAPVFTYGLDQNRLPLVPTGADAAQVVAWYDFSHLPGSGSNAVFSGHVTWGGHAVFWALDELQPRETIKVKAEDGREYTYEVFANFRVDPSDPASLKVMADTSTDIITLITCGGSWIPDPSAQLGGDYTERTIVQGKLVAESLTAPVPRAISGG